MCAYIPSLLPTTTPIPSIWIITELQAELPVLCSMFPLAICENKILNEKNNLQSFVYNVLIYI